MRGHTVFVSHFPRFSVFWPISRSYSVHFSFSTFLSVSLHIPGPTVYISYFPFLECFLPYSRSYCVYFSFFTFFSVSSSIVGCTVFVSHFARFSVIFAIFQALPCEFLIFLLCQVLLDIFQVLQCLCSIFHFFQWFLPYSRSYHISFSFSSFDIFLAIFQVLK